MVSGVNDWPRRHSQEMGNTPPPWNLNNGNLQSPTVHAGTRKERGAERHGLNAHRAGCTRSLHAPEDAHSAERRSQRMRVYVQRMCGPTMCTRGPCYRDKCMPNRLQLRPQVAPQTAHFHADCLSRFPICITVFQSRLAAFPWRGFSGGPQPRDHTIAALPSSRCILLGSAWCAVGFCWFGWFGCVDGRCFIVVFAPQWSVRLRFYFPGFAVLGRDPWCLPRLSFFVCSRVFWE